MILLAYARHKKMGLFILDLQGEFALDLKGSQSKTSVRHILNQSILMGLGREFEVYDLSNFRLGNWELLGELLTDFGFFTEMGIKAVDYRITSASYIIDFFKDSKHKLSALSNDAFRDCIQHIHDHVLCIYAGGSGIERVQGFIQEASQKSEQGGFLPLKEKWDKVIKFFSNESGKASIEQIILRALSVPKTGSRPLVVVDLSKRPEGISTGIWDEKIKPISIDAFLGALIRQAEEAYGDKKGSEHACGLRRSS